MSVQEMDLQNGHSVDVFKFDLTSTGDWFDRQMPSIVGDFAATKN
jgi:hypothetical protein